MVVEILTSLAIIDKLFCRFLKFSFDGLLKGGGERIG